MAEGYQRRAVSVVTALDLLIEDAQSGAEHLAKIRVDFDGSGLDPVGIWRPVASGNALPPGVLGLAEGVATLLMMAADRPARPPASSNEWMFVSDRADEKALFALLRRLSRRATPARVACCERGKGARLWFVHVHADRRRPSGLPGLVAANAWRGWSRLSGHAYGDTRVFLPDTVTPRPNVFTRAGVLLNEPATRTVLALEPQGPRREHFVIVMPVPGTAERFEMPRLPGRAFRNAGDLVATVGVDVRRVELKADPGGEDVLARLATDAPDRGYRMALRPVRHAVGDELELRRLRQQQAGVEQRVAYLESIVQERPRLLRFASTSDQLRKLAHVLYTFPADILGGPRPKVTYAFQASVREPAGRHYLLIARDAVRLGADPLERYTGGPRVKFWLDPSWSRYYHDDRHASSLVFVPERTALFPSLHTWSVQEMDAHLQHLFAPSATGGDPGPASARLFVFDQADEPGRLEVTVLDSAAFGPVGTSLRWLSDNLAVATRVARSAAVRKTATAGRLERALADAVSQLEGARRSFDAERARTMEEFRSDFEEIVSEITTYSTSALQKAHEADVALRDLGTRTRSLVDVKGRGEADLKPLAELLGHVKAGIAPDDELGRIELAVAQALLRARSASEEADRWLKEYVDTLQRKKSELLEALHEDEDEEEPL